MGSVSLPASVCGQLSVSSVSHSVPSVSAQHGEDRTPARTQEEHTWPPDHLHHRPPPDTHHWTRVCSSQVTELKIEVPGRLPVQHEAAVRHLQGVGAVWLGALRAGLLTQEDLQVYQEHLLWLRGRPGLLPHQGRHHTELL